MTEFFTVKQIDNSRLVRFVAPNHMRECARVVLLGGLIALCAFLYAWQHFETIQLRYELESLRSERAQATELNQELKLEMAGLRAPERIDMIARRQLGLDRSRAWTSGSDGSAAECGDGGSAPGKRSGGAAIDFFMAACSRVLSRICAPERWPPETHRLKPVLVPGENMDLRSPRTRIMIVAALAAIWTGAVFGRLAYLQLFRYSEYYSRAQHQQRLIVDVGASRAEIFDRNMNPLAMSVPVDSAFAVPSEIADPDMVARLIGKVLDVPSDEIATRIASSHSFAWIARKLPPEKADRIAAMNLRGIYFQREGGRFYPKRELAAHVLGYVDIDEKGLGGIEYSLDDSIRSKPGKMLILADAHRRWYDSTDKAPDTGTSVVLTLDEKIQYIAEKELAQAIQDTHAKSGTVIVENPNSGELLAVANWPTFNPNAAKDSPPEARVDRAASSLYEPGSVFKIVTLSAAIDQGVTNPDEVVDCQNGAIYIAGHRIRDHKAYGNLTVSQILQYSSDVGAIKVGLRLGAPKFYDYIRAFGFGQPTGVDLPGESRGKLRRLENWTPVSVGSISMGQEVGVTPLQMISAVSAMANGGLIVRPHVVRELRRGKPSHRARGFSSCRAA